ncbi:hypothetical protein AGLY_012710, partial [Aphis glycines]
YLRGNRKNTSRTSKAIVWWSYLPEEQESSSDRVKKRGNRTRPRLTRTPVYARARVCVTQTATNRYVVLMSATTNAQQKKKKIRCRQVRARLLHDKSGGSGQRFPHDTPPSSTTPPPARPPPTTRPPPPSKLDIQAAAARHVAGTMSSTTAGQSTSASAGVSTNSVLEKLGLLLIALVVLRLTRAAMKFAYRHVLGPSALCRGTVDFVKCGKWAGTYPSVKQIATTLRSGGVSSRRLDCRRFEPSLRRSAVTIFRRGLAWTRTGERCSLVWDFTTF